MDPVSIFSLVTICISSSASVYKAIDSLTSCRDEAKHLKTEVGDLNIVLQALEKNVQESTENFEVLRLILDQCNRACEEFVREVINKIGKGQGFFQEIRSVARLQLLRSHINNFRTLISSYKATLTIALADSNLRTVKITRKLLEEYTELSQRTKSGLEEQIAELGYKLDLLRSEGSQTHSTTVSVGLENGSHATQQALEQKASLEQCLVVCRQLLDHIKVAACSIPRQTTNTTDATSDDQPAPSVDGVASRVTTDALNLCAYNINAASQHLQDLQRLKLLPAELDHDQIIQQLTTAQSCLGVISSSEKHRVNVYENIQTAEDSFQTVVSTMGDLIRATGLTIGARSVNIMGQMNDESLQKITGHLRTDVVTRSNADLDNSTFEKKHGFGHTISSRKSNSPK